MKKIFFKIFAIILAIGAIIFLFKDINNDISLLKNHAKKYAKDNHCFSSENKSLNLICKDHIASFNEDNNILWVRYREDIEKIYVEKDRNNSVVVQLKNGEKLQFEYYGSLQDFIKELKQNNFPFVEN